VALSTVVRSGAHPCTCSHLELNGGSSGFHNECACHDSGLFCSSSAACCLVRRGACLRVPHHQLGSDTLYQALVPEPSLSGHHPSHKGLISGNLAGTKPSLTHQALSRHLAGITPPTSASFCSLWCPAAYLEAADVGTNAFRAGCSAPHAAAAPSALLLPPALPPWPPQDDVVPVHWYSPRPARTLSADWQR
jgi:hypothetical protein